MSAFPELIVWGAQMRTLDPTQPNCSAIAIKDGAIVATGDDDTVRAMRGPGTTIVDGRGIAFIPGLTDSHIHPLMGAIRTRGADLFKANSLVEARAILAEERQRVGPGNWVLGWGLHYELFAETGIRGALLDDAVGGQPLMIVFFDGHTAVANKAALDLAAVGGPIDFDEEAAVVCDNEVPTGELKEWAAMDLVRRVVPEPDADTQYGWFREAFRRFSAMGLTSLHGMDGTPAEFDVYRRLEENGDLTCRVVVPLWQKPDMTSSDMRAQLPYRDERGRLWRGGAAKFFIDGVIETGTGWLVEPDTNGDGTRPFWPDPARYAEAVALFADAGFQCITHAVGDRGVQAALDAYEAAQAAGSRSLFGPHRIEHIELVQDRDIPRFRKLNVTASMQPLHMEAATADDSDEWAIRVGTKRTAKAFRARALLDAGATLALGSDWMVAPFDPRIGMAWARLRRAPQQEEVPPRAPDQALSAFEALEGYTTGAAEALAESHLSGRLQPGYRGDLTGFAADPVDTDADALIDLPIVMTIVDGRIVHEAR